MLELSGKKCILREFTNNHLQDPKYFSWLRDIDVVRTIYRIEYLVGVPFSTIEVYVNNLLQSQNDCFFAMHNRSDGSFIGTARIGHINWRTAIADVGLMIGEKSFWGKGYGSDAVATLGRYAFKSLSMRKLTGGTAETNIGMVRCFLKCGFVEEGRLRKQLLIDGDYCDHLLFGLLKENYHHTSEKTP